MKDVSEISGLRNNRSMSSSDKRSISQLEIFGHLHILYKEKDRLEKELYPLDKRIKDIRKKLDDVNKQMDELQKQEVERKESVGKEFKKSEKDWKTVPLQY
ncbi:MAG: hypothetical protein L6420_02500 [Elusimicrobia bacterium]|nr:hypothetical protein [Elusimicrobiota bacterium]